MKTRATTLLLLGYMLAAAGLLVPFWPLALGGVMIAGLSGVWPLAILLGLLLDLIYGVPVGYWHFLYVPFTILAAVVSILERYSARYVISDAQEYL